MVDFVVHVHDLSSIYLAFPGIPAYLSGHTLAPIFCVASFMVKICFIDISKYSHGLG